MSIEMLENKLAVEQVETTEKSDNTGFFKTPELCNNAGIVKYASKNAMDKGLMPGTKVYFGNKFQSLVIGTELRIMEIENVVAKEVK